MATFVWVNNEGILNGTHRITSKPNIGVDYVALYWEPNNKFYVDTEGKKQRLDEDHLRALADSLQDARGSRIKKRLGVDSDGDYLGPVEDDDPQVAAFVPRSPPNGDHWRWDFQAKTWVYNHAVAADGSYLGNRPIGDPEVAAFVSEGTDDKEHIWNGTRWVLPLAVVEKRRLSKIEDAFQRKLVEQEFASKVIRHLSGDPQDFSALLSLVVKREDQRDGRE